MPFHKDPMSFGNLFIVFEVEFPKKGELKNVEELKKTPPSSSKPNSTWQTEMWVFGRLWWNFIETRC